MDKYHITIKASSEQGRGTRRPVIIDGKPYYDGAEAVVDEYEFKRILQSHCVEYAICRRLRNGSVTEGIVVLDGEEVVENHVLWLPVNKDVNFSEMRSSLEEKRLAAAEEAREIFQATTGRKRIDEMWPLVRRPSQLFIFGAGAAAPYGIPVWKDLKELMLRKLKEKFHYGHNHIFLPQSVKKQLGDILNKVGGKYKTIDQAISAEVEAGGDDMSAMDIERRFFDVMSLCIDDYYVEKKHKGQSTDGLKWIGELLRADKKIIENANFISFNYDATFPFELLRYYRYLTSLVEEEKEEASKEADRNFPPKQRFLRSEKRKGYDNAIMGINENALREIEKLKLNFSTKFFFPHGVFVRARAVLSELEVIPEHFATYVDKNSGLHTGFGGGATSCHDVVGEDDVFTKINKAHIRAEHLYVIGVGAGLQENLDKINFRMMGVKKIFYTCFNPKDEEYYEEYFLEGHKFWAGVELESFKDCDEFAATYVKKASRWK